MAKELFCPNEDVLTSSFDKTRPVAAVYMLQVVRKAGVSGNGRRWWYQIPLGTQVFKLSLTFFTPVPKLDSYVSCFTSLKQTYNPTVLPQLLQVSFGIFM